MVFLLTLGCNKDVPLETGEGLFRAGCPIAGEAHARVLADPEERPFGSDAIAKPGDVVLLNEEAAWVIGDPTAPVTYIDYGGNPVDAIRVKDCEQLADERFGELGFLVGELHLDDWQTSVLRMFEGESMTIVEDGSDGGAAVVEVYGRDARFYLVELTLLEEAYLDGKELWPAEPFGLEMTVRYTLEPNDPVLQTEVLFEGTSSETHELMAALIEFPTDRGRRVTFADSAASMAGFTMDLGVPWVGTSDGLSSTAITIPDARLSRMGISGVTVLVDADMALEPFPIAEGDVGSMQALLSVGAGGTSEATCALSAHNPEPIPGKPVAVVRVSGSAPGADLVEVWAPNNSGVLDLLDTVAVTDGGVFDTWLTDLGEGLSLRAVGEGRNDGAFVDLDGDVSDLELPVEPRGDLGVFVVDSDGEPITTRVQLQGETSSVHYPLSGELVHVPPGTYDVYVSKGYEWEIWEGVVSVPGTLSISLEQVVEHPGWRSTDSHIHNEPSADSRVLPEDRARTVAAAGLDGIVTTDHEAIVDLSWAALAVDEEPTFLLGSEITATFPEHSNAWPFPVVEDHPRGDPVDWYELGFPGIYAATRARGAEVIQINHARVNGECGILCVLDWDRASEPGMDAARFLVEGEVWSWDFDAFEVLNSTRCPFLDPADPRHTGAFTDWLAFHNLGHRVTGMAVTDAHGLDMPGVPRTYLDVETHGDEVTATLAGAAVMSAGAFAEVSIGEVGPGGTTSSTTLDIVVRALPQIDVTEVMVLANCELVETLSATDPYEVDKLSTRLELELEEDSHVVVLGFGELRMPTGLGDDYDPATVPRFISNPIFVDLDGDGWTPPGPRDCWTPLAL
ncbi:MAG TPA: CehA/McbA family metallohydrolase [Myxococcota bacterium]|nr:CehA/McbA family metallohydrolase [Myxococcota bacterium]